MNQTATTKTIANPFLFLQPYGLSDHYVLKGRDQEALQLLALLKWKDIVVVFGKSGVGKTSFINHTLSARINRVNWLPIRITRLLNINQSLLHNIQKALAEESIDKIHSENVYEPVIMTGVGDAPHGGDVVQLINDLYIKWNRPVYLIIDQLEELFLIGNQQEQTDFLKTLQSLMDTTGIQKKIILVLREEHLGYIQEVERILNGVFQDALAVKEIKKEEGGIVFDSLLTSNDPDKDEPLRQFADIVTSAGVKDRIIESCSQGEAFDAQKLQILLFLLWEKVYGGQKIPAGEEIRMYVEQLYLSTDPLRDYLDISVNERLAAHARLLKAPYWFILRNAISPANTKKPVALSDLYQLMMKELEPGAATGNYNNLYPSFSNFQVGKADLFNWCRDLTDKKILQVLSIVEQAEDTEYYYQLRHDTLVACIHKLDTNLSLRFPKRVSMDEQEDNPYQGLRQYDYHENSQRASKMGRRRKTHALPKLYGREAIVKEYIELLTKTNHQCLVVVGDSGTGKSSLVKGGLLPAMQEAGFETTTLQPGPDLDGFTQEIRNVIGKNKNTLPVSKHCLYIDQFEECYTFRDASPEEKKKFDDFLHFLSQEMNSPGDHFKLIVSIRHDYAHEFDRNISDWRKFKRLLRYPNQDEIFDIIVGPAYDKGIRFSPADLPERIAADAVNTSYFLPLLSFTMQTLHKLEVKKYNEVQHNGKHTLCLTAAGYEEIGGIVRCLQREFTRTFQMELSAEEQRLFPELMARMIIIKDTIPKAQPLSVDRIYYAREGKAEMAHMVLKKFTPQFFRERQVSTSTGTSLCYEPIHDSLLVYCDEIRQIINKVQEPKSQMYLQPRIEAAVKEWKGETAGDSFNDNTGTSQIAADKLEEVIRNRYKELEPLYAFLDDTATATNNWLFKDELALVIEGKKYADDFRNTEEQTTAQRLRELELERNRQKLATEKLLAENQLHLAKAQQSEQELLVKKLQAEANAARAKEDVKRKRRWITFLCLFLLVGSAWAIAWYSRDNEKKKQKDQYILQQGAYIDRIRSDSSQLSAYSDSLQREKNIIQLKTDSLNRVDSINNKLIIKLNNNERKLTAAIRDLVAKRDTLIEVINSKNLAIEDRDKANKALEATNKALTEAQDSVNILRNDRMVTLAQLNRKTSPALSYWLADSSLKHNPYDTKAAGIRNGLLKEDQYFETLVIDNVATQHVSRDGTRIVTVQPDPQSVNNYFMKIWDVNGKQIGQTIELPDKVDVAEFSFDNKKILLVSDNALRTYDCDRHLLGLSYAVANLQYARFAETDNRLFAVSNKKILILSSESNVLSETRGISFESEGIINNARLWDKDLTIITPKGIKYWHMGRRLSSSTKNLPQSFIVNGSRQVISLEKPLFGGTRKLVLFDSTMRQVWQKKVPDKAFNLMAGYVNSSDGRFAIIRFNEKESIYQYTQQQQQQQQQVQKQVQDLRTKSASASSTVLLADNLYYLDIGNGNLQPFENTSISSGRYILSANNDSLFEYSTGSIRKFPVNVQMASAGVGMTISQNTRFKEIYLAGAQKNLLLSVDANNQLKLWRFVKAGDPDSRKYLWKPSKEELEKILQVN